MQRGLEYEVVPNALTAETGIFSFKVLRQKIHKEPAVIDAILAKFPHLKREQVIDVFEGIDIVWTEFAGNGEGADTRFARFSHSLHGKATPDELFNRMKHRTEVNMLPGKNIAEAGANAAVHKVPSNDPGPHIISVTDLLDKAQNSTIRRGHIIRIIGQGIKFAGDNARLDFIDSAGTPLKTIAAADIPVNTPSEVMFNVPDDLPLGKCRIRITTAYSHNGKVLKTPHSTAFDVELTVLEAAS
jgi:hypothetical protein